MATNATIFVFIESDGVIVIFIAGQHQTGTTQEDSMTEPTLPTEPLRAEHRDLLPPLAGARDNRR